MKPLPGLQDFISWCDENSIPTIVVTNAPRTDAEYTLRTIGQFERYGANMVIGQECSNPKPHPAPYLEGLLRIGAERRHCVAFEDSINGCKSSVGAGLFTIGIETGLNENELIQAGANLSIRNYKDPKLWKMIKNLN
mmetsp:Transcript_20082/g.29683  ORF Transcript_20082/g.29683 Transcript_20082/m.29683 type:complete len:137 (+) Transcript_20082:613-1023(+)